MHLARVIGDVVATRKDENLNGLKLLILQPLTPERQPAGRTLIAVDSVGAGVGEEVFFVRGREASFPFSGRSACRCRHRGHRRSLDARLMQMARVIGTVVSTQKNKKFEGAKLLLVQPIDPDDKPRGNALLAVDGVGAGVHERVLVVLEGRARQVEALGKKAAPVDAAIIGIIDHVEFDGRL